MHTHTRRRTRLGAAITTVALLAVGSPTVQAAPAPDVEPLEAPQVRAPVPDIAWQACEGEGLDAFDCASVQVPTDYDRQRGRTTTIALTRLRATDPEQRIGSLFVNFGGPGIAGVQAMHTLGETFLDPQVHAGFDVIGFDPRGVGQSDPVTCFPDDASEKAFLAGTPVFPTTPRESAEFLATYGAAAAGCEVLSGNRVAHASTANVARDLDLLRQAVGDEQLTYLGYSYGSIPGATYAALFPGRVRALAVDGVWDPAAWSGGEGSVGVRLGQGVAASEAFERFLALCEQAGPDACSLATLGDPADVAEDVFDRLQEQPVPYPADDGSIVEIGYDEMVFAAYDSLYKPAEFGSLADFFTELAILSAPKPTSEQRRTTSPPGDLGDLLRRLGLIEDYASLGAELASMCVDGQHPLRPGDYVAQADAADEVAPHFGRFRSWLGVQCEFVRFRDGDAYRGSWEQQTQAPVLVIGTRYDPATPYAFTQPYADRFPDSRVLTVEGYGHTTLGRSTCANAAIATYLIELEATDGASCGQDVAPFQPVSDVESGEVTPSLTAPTRGVPED